MNVRESNKLGLMLDLETLGLGPKSVITQVGVIAFPLDDPDTETRRIEEYLPVQPQLALGRQISFSTILWWMEQEDKAREKLKESSGDDMEVLLSLVRSIHRKISELIASVGAPNIELWAKGPQFDVVMLESLFVDCGLSAPWPYDCVMDLRTLGKLAGVSSRDLDRGGLVPHIAAEDAKFQIRHYAAAHTELSKVS